MGNMLPLAISIVNLSKHIYYRDNVMANESSTLLESDSSLHRS